MKFIKKIIILLIIFNVYDNFFGVFGDKYKIKNNINIPYNCYQSNTDKSCDQCDYHFNLSEDKKHCKHDLCSTMKNSDKCEKCKNDVELKNDDGICICKSNKYFVYHIKSENDTITINNKCIVANCLVYKERENGFMDYSNCEFCMDGYELRKESGNFVCVPIQCKEKIYFIGNYGAICYHNLIKLLADQTPKSSE